MFQGSDSSKVGIAVFTIGLASRFVKDFTVDWSDGYRPLAVGAGIILVIRAVLSVMLYGVIASFV